MAAISETRKKRIVVVLGMHRSGTSAITRGLKVMGVELGDKLMPAQEHVNEKGFWEDLDFTVLNDELLNNLGLAWHSLTPTGQNDSETLRKKGYFTRATELLLQKADKHGIYGFKDPRVAKLLPFWKEVFEFDQLDTRYILIIRHPLSVAKSLARRDGFDERKSYYLWLGHVIQSLSGSTPRKRVLVDYDKLMQAPATQITRIAGALGFEVDEVELQRYASEFLDKTLRHTIYDLNDLRSQDDCPHLVREIYAKLLDVASDAIHIDDPELRNDIGRWTEEYEKLKSLLGLTDKLFLQEENQNKKRAILQKALTEREEQIAEFEQTLAEGEQQITRLEQALTEREQQIGRFEQTFANFEQAVTKADEQIAAVYNSTCWRITAPLRAVSRGLTQARSGLSSAIASAPRLLIKQYRAHPKLQKFVRGCFSLSQNLSITIVDPIFPRVHELLFVTMERHVRQHLQSCPSVSYPPFAADSKSLYAKDSTGNFFPKVSVIVPNYNHACFLRQRLDSVYHQTYPNFEVILLDDASTDNSREILEEYRKRYSPITRCDFNKRNSGSVFAQWQRGFEMASGDLIWIAESDDFCSENLLADLVKYFENEAVMLAYSRTVFIQQESGEPVWNLEQYLTELDPELWLSPFVMSAHRLVNKAWGIKNIVPNVSSAVFRHPRKLGLLDDEKWKQMKLCGDWVFYLHIIRGGLVAYTPASTNYYRLHQSNTSVSTHDKDIYYKEHEVVAQELLKLYQVDNGILDRQGQMLKLQWHLNRMDYSDDAFKKCYDPQRVHVFSMERKPNLMMASFALIAGGGETFPIKLANMLKAAGYGITFLNCQKAPTEVGVRDMLRKDIPLLELDSFEKWSTVIDDMGIEIIHSHHGWVDANICHFVKSDSNVKLVVTTHGMYETIPPVELAQVLPLLKKRVSKFVYLSDKNLAPFISHGFDTSSFVRIDNAVDISPIMPVPRSELGIPEDAFLICLVSRAIPEKGWQEGIEAVKLARKISGRDIHLLLVGAGPEYDRLRPVVKDSFIHFLGFRPNTRDYFATSDLGFLPSRFTGESFPLVLIECLHSNRPMLASNVGEIRNMLATERGNAGAVFNLENRSIPITSVAEIIATYAGRTDFYLDHLQRVPEAARKFDPEIMLSRYEKVYLEVFRGTSGSEGNAAEVEKRGPLLEIGI